MRVEFVIGALLATAFWAIVELFFKADATGLWEVIKLIVQFSGALIIARLTVYWALSRFKSEKGWERQTTAFAEVISVLREFDRILDQFYEDEIHARSYSEAYLARLNTRSQEVRDRYQKASSLAAIVLPNDISEIIVKLEAALADGNYNSQFDAIENESHLVKTAIKELASKKHTFI